MLNGDDRSGKGLFTADSGFGGGDLFFVYANMPFGCHFAAPQFVCFFIFEKTLLRQRHLGKMSAVTPAFARAHKKKKKILQRNLSRYGAMFFFFHSRFS